MSTPRSQDDDDRKQDDGREPENDDDREAEDDREDEDDDRDRYDERRDDGTDARGAEDEDEDEDEPVAPRKPYRPPLKNSIVPSLLFLAGALFLTVFVNLRYPGAEPRYWYFAPSLDIVIIFMCLAWAGQLSWRIPKFLFIGAVVWLLTVRFMRIGDGVQERFFGQTFNLHSDLPLIPEAIRFVYSTRPLWQFVLGTLVAISALVGLVILCYRVLRFSERYLRDIRHVYIAAAFVGLGFVVVKSIPFNRRWDPLLKSGFAASAMPRLFHEAELLLNIYGEEAAFVKTIALTEKMLEELPSDLSKLERANVHFILVESYGRAMFEVPAHVSASRKTFERFERELTDKGFQLASGMYDSPTYGGQSWLAHATIGTGVRTTNQLEYEVVLARKPKTLATFFREAGYRTVMMMPGTTREWPRGEFYNFETKYYLWHFGYKGPKFSWATMSDQYLLDVVRRRELPNKSRPLFIQYVLVSSHAPWSTLPPIIDDWSKVGDGSIYHQIPPRRFPIEWPHFENATEAYAASIVYDFEILREYIGQFIDDGSLVIVMGDHQPVPEVNGHSPEHGVPVHVLSRNPELIKPFLERGYLKGLRPNLSAFHQGLEAFLPNLLVDFSRTKPARTPNAP